MAVKVNSSVKRSLFNFPVETMRHAELSRFRDAIRKRFQLHFLVSFQVFLNPVESISSCEDSVGIRDGVFGLHK